MLAQRSRNGDNSRKQGTLGSTTNTMNDELVRAIDMALEGQWEASHNIVQQYDSDRTASWIHAVLHKIEGDRGNSMYWYSRAGKTEFADHEPMAELHAIKTELG